MAQGGDPTGTGTGGARDLPRPARRIQQGQLHARRLRHGPQPEPEQRQQPVLHLLRAEPSFLDGQYTVWGRVISGMDVVDKIKRGAPGSGTVNGPDKLIRASIAAA